MRISALLAVLAAPAFADCPPVVDYTAEMDLLIAEAQRAETAQGGRYAAQAMWAVWMKAPDQKAQDLLNRGLSHLGSGDLTPAREVFSELVDYCPDYAEGYNQRAFVAFLRNDFPEALRDLDKAIARSPRHVAAISGKALTLQSMGRFEESQKVLREALALNPWIPERRYLKEIPGEDI